MWRDPLAGMLLGAVVSGAAAYFAQTHQARIEVDLRRRDAETAAVERLEGGLWQIRQHAFTAPDENVKQWSEGARRRWGEPIEDMVGRLAIAARGIRA
ncbi:hypothetical protein GCM10009802_05030 [Streptomyces synnematoformans]|uniref:Uncharacterized protein n=1 Tax=Streptomyces synnematoformans TaxID=415721 RepID=A0ABN2XCA1_9ACTN